MTTDGEQTVHDRHLRTRLAVGSQVRVVVVMGVSGTGKTTFAEALARHLRWPFQEGDDLHPAANIAKMTAGQPLDDDDRWPWLARVGTWIRTRVDENGPGIITCSALKRSYRDLLAAPGVVFVHLGGTAEQIADQLRSRTGHFMSGDLLESQLAILEPLGEDEPGINLAIGRNTEDLVAEVMERLSLTETHHDKGRTMQLGMVGLGRMGGNMAERLRTAGHDVIGFDVDSSISEVASLPDLVAALTDAPRVVWVMVPVQVLDGVLDELAPLLNEGDIVIDGGNTKWTGDSARAAKLDARGVHFIDCGVSGGVWGREAGYALMCGGDAADIAAVQPIFDALKPEGEHGFVHAGAHGAGHFAKMVHNGIEYSLMQAYAEGWELLEKAEVVTDVPAVFESWREGTVIRSWLLDLISLALVDDPRLSNVRGYADDSGEGRWTVDAAIDLGVPVPALAAALFARFVSRQEESPAMKLVAAMRQQFGGHAIHTTSPSVDAI